MLKKSATVNAVKLKKIESILKRGEAMNKQECADLCDVLFENNHTDWLATQIVCAIAGWESSTCGVYIDGVLAADDRWAAAGCDTGPLGTVIVKNTNRKIPMIRTESFG